MRCVVLLISAIALLPACDDGLGSCDEAAVMPLQAQGVLGKCTSCHSSEATGAARVGAPAGLDFDTAAGRDEWAAEMWAEIEADRMPPPPPAGTGKLSADEKELMREWLACGAEDADLGDGDTWTAIWSEISTSGGCVGCHEAGTPAAIGGGAAFEVAGDPCGALDNLLGVATVGPQCGGTGDYIVASDADASILVQKLRGGDAVSCGDPMPPGPGLANSKPELVDSLAAWIDAGATAPECE